MKACYHFTNTSNLEQILTEGLKPSYGVNSQLISDSKGEKLYYSVGEEATVHMFSSLHSMILRALDGRITPELLETYSDELKQKLETSTDLASWMGEGVYLAFDGDILTDANEEKPIDSYTSEEISPDNIYVCAIKNNETGEIVSSLHSDIINYFIAKLTNDYQEVLHLAGFYGLDIKEQVEEIRKSPYTISYMPLSEYMELTNSNQKQRI